MSASATQGGHKEVGWGLGQRFEFSSVLWRCLFDDKKDIRPMNNLCLRFGLCWPLCMFINYILFLTLLTYCQRFASGMSRGSKVGELANPCSEWKRPSKLWHIYVCCSVWLMVCSHLYVLLLAMCWLSRQESLVATSNHLVSCQPHSLMPSFFPEALAPLRTCTWQFFVHFFGQILSSLSQRLIHKHQQSYCSWFP